VLDLPIIPVASMKGGDERKNKPKEPGGPGDEKQERTRPKPCGSEEIHLLYLWSRVPSSSEVSPQHERKRGVCFILRGTERSCEHYGREKNMGNTNKTKTVRSTSLL